MKYLNKGLLVLVCLVMVVTISGCKRHAPVIDPGFGGGGGVVGPGRDDPNNPEGLPKIPLESLEPFESGEKYGLAPVYFDFDSSALRPEAIGILGQNAGRIKALTGKTVQIAGHCDERGTQEYNLALGEARALVVRDYLVRMGVPGDRLITISYGKEMPAVSGTGEEVWAKNRRAEFAVTR